MIQKHIVDFSLLADQPEWQSILTARIAPGFAGTLKEYISKLEDPIVLVFYDVRPSKAMDELEDLQQKYDNFYAVWGPEGSGSSRTPE